MTAADAARIVSERDNILALPEFRHAPGWFERLLLPLLASVQEWFAHLSAPAYWTVMGALVLAVVAGIVHVFYTLSIEARRTPWGTGVAPAVAASTTSSLPDLASAARAEWLAGHHAEAVRLAWLASIAALDQVGISRAGAGRADWEHVAAIRGRGLPEASEVEALAVEFQRSRFGAASVDGASAERALARLEAVRRGIGAVAGG